jgi:c-di-GMP phosphodiesterase
VHRFWYLRRLILAAVAIALLLSLVMAAPIAWRATHLAISHSAQRAVLNAERMIERTAADLQKLDALRLSSCEPVVIEKLKDSVYNAVAQIREIGLIQNSRLFCTNFGPTDVSLEAERKILEIGTHIGVGPNSVVPNNTSLYVYVSRAEGSAVNAVLNPMVLAEFERGFNFTGRGQLEMLFNGPSSSRPASKDSEQVYQIGRDDKPIDPSTMLSRRYASTRYPLIAEVRAERGAFWDEYFPVLQRLLVPLLALGLISAFAINHWLSAGGLDRTRFQKALRREQFRVYYQPIVSAQSRRMVGVEALLRWQHPRKGLLRAAQFAEIFNDQELDEAVTRFVLSTVARDLSNLPSHAQRFWCSVNVAPALMEKSGVANEIARQLKSLPHDRLRIEITERTPISPISDANLRELRAQGIKIGLDDLGTGYSNLSQLQTMVYDFIKIDGVLVRGIQSLEVLSPVVENLILMAQKIGTEIIAEGVETQVQAQALSKHGVNLLQGYLFGPAIPFQDVVKLLDAERQPSLKAVPS